MATNVDEEKIPYPHIVVTGGPAPASMRYFRDGVEMHSVVEFQINGGMETPTTAIFKELVTFDGNVDLMPLRKLNQTSH